jgi:hypothetical protein
MILDLHNKLSLRNWERALFRHPYTIDEGWTKRLKSEGLIIDLSKVGWIEPAALVRLVLFIEGALLNGAGVSLRLPLKRPTRAEQLIIKGGEQSRNKNEREKARYTAKGVQRRKDAAKVLDRMRLLEALSHPHLATFKNSLAVIENYDWSMSAEDQIPQLRTLSHSENQVRDASTPWYFRIAYGLQWISAPRSERGKETIDHLAEVNVLADILAHPSGRVLAADGQTLAYVFLKELVENSVDHSGREFALVAAWSRPNSVNLKDSEILKCEQNFANWCKGYPLLEVVVGDSGTGIPSTLRSAYKQQREPSALPEPGQSEDDHILAWSFDKWSSRFPGDRRRGTRGLYRVERIVQKYDGCITLRSESSFVGIDSGFASPPSFIFEKKRLARSPGTIVHARLPVMMAERMPERIMIPPLHQATFEVLECYDRDWKNGAEAIKRVLNDVVAACRKVSTQRRPACVIADFGFATMERRTLEQLLRELIEIAHPVSIVVANIKGPSWESSKETIHSLAEQLNRDGSLVSSAEAPDALHVKDAILFKHAYGRFAWVGVRESIGSYLNSLWEKGTMSSKELSKICPDVDDRNQLLRQFAEAYHVATRTDGGGGLSLKFNSEDIQEQLCKHTEDRVKKIIDLGDSPAVLRGVCRTPSLGIVKRFVNIFPLIRQIGLERATGILAQKTLRLREVEDAEKIQIIANWKTDRQILDSFRRNLIGTIHRPIDIEISQVSPRDLPVIPEESLVILFTGVILTGDSATNLLSQVIRARRTKAIVVSVVDGRLRGGEPLRALGHSIKTVSLAEMNMVASEAERVTAEKEGTLINISPLSHLPEKYIGQRSDATHGDRLLRDMIDEEDALYFNHIARPNGRHFCFYLDAFKLLGALDTADPTSISHKGMGLIRSISSSIDANISSKTSIDLICIPNFPRSEKPSAAEIIANELGSLYRADINAITPTGDLIPLIKHPLAGTRGQRLPEQLELLGTSKPKTSRVFKNILIFDWGALTGKNLRDSIRFASKVGVENILAIIFLSHLPFEDEEFLTSIQGVESSNSHVTSENGEDRHRWTRVQVKFLRRFPLQSYDRLSCPYCRQIERLNNEEALFATDLLQDFLEEAKLRLRPRTLQEVREEHQRISEVGPDNGDPDWHITEIAEIRTWLDKARDSTRVRHELYLKLCSTEVQSRRGDSLAKLWRKSLILLLALEWTWLKQEPLNFSLFKRQIADLALQQTLDESCSVDDRREAIVVLRTTSKERFAKHLPALFRALISSHELTPQLLYGAFTYLHRDYLMTESLRPLVESLSICAKEVREKVGLAVSLAVGRTINALHLFGTFVMRKADDGEVSSINAWRFLRNEWADRYDAHHPLADSIRGLFLGYIEDNVLDAAKDLPVFDWHGARRKWDLVERHIVQILSWIEPLQPVFEGLQECGFLTPADASNLALASTQDSLSRTLTLRTQLDMFANRPGSVRDYGQWEAFLKERTWFWDVFFNPGIHIKGEIVRPSALLTILKSCPCDLAQVLTSVLTELAITEPQQFNISLRNSPDEPLWVFCHEDVMEACLRELLNNARRHSKKTEVEVLNLLISLDLGSEIQLSVKNDGGPKRSIGMKRGLTRFRQVLRAYGGDLNGRLLDAAESGENSNGGEDISWFYEAVLTIPRW